MTTQDKETHMHETIARASLVAFAEFIGQPISDLDATFRQARGLYGLPGSIACVVKVPVDNTKPIHVAAVDGGPIQDGVTVDGDVVRASYYLHGRTSSSLRSCVAAMPNYAARIAAHLATERAKLTPPAPPPPKPNPTSQAIASALVDVSATLASLAERIRNENP